VRQPKKARPFLRDHLLDDPLDDLAVGGVLRQEEHAHAVLAGAGQVDPDLGAGFLEEAMGDLEEQPRAIAGAGVAAGRATVRQVLEEAQAHSDEIMRLLPLHVRHETDPAGIVFEPGS